MGLVLGRHPATASTLRRLAGLVLYAGALGVIWSAGILALLLLLRGDAKVLT